MPKQDPLPLINGLQASYATAGKRLLTTIREVIALHVPKRIVLAEDIGIKEQHLSDALNENGKHFAVQWLPAVCRYDREHRVAAEVGSWHGLKVVEREPISDGEWRARVSRVLDRMNGVGAAVLREAMEDQ